MNTIKQPNLIKDLIPEEYQLKDPIYEMADELKMFRRDIRNAGGNIYEHIILICVLGNRLPYVEHWKTEIKSFALPVFMTNLKKGTSKVDYGKFVRSEMMAHFMGAHFEDYDIEQFDDALKNEIENGDYMLQKDKYKKKWSVIRAQQKIIKEVRSNLTEEMVQKCLEPIKEFYDKFVEAATKRSRVTFNKLVDDFQPVL